MTQQNNGGPAFPRPHTTADANSPYFKAGHEGVTLRDYFAIVAMRVDYEQAGGCPDPDWRYGIALDAYKMADAMLKARNSQ